MKQQQVGAPSTPVSSLPEAQNIEVSLPNYENYVGIDSHQTVDAEWKIPYLERLDHQFTGAGYEESSTNKDLLSQMKQIFEATSEKEYLSGKGDAKTRKVKETVDSYAALNRQIDNLLEGTNEKYKAMGVDRLKASEVREASEDVMNAVSDEITKIQTQIGYAEETYPMVNTELDFRTASRRQIADAIGLENILNEVKRLFNTEDEEKCSLDGMPMLQADYLFENWDAVVALGSDFFTLNEGYGMARNFFEYNYYTTDGQKVGFDNFNDNNSDPDAAGEVSAKDEQERWQVESRTIDVLNSMSDLVRQGLRQCFLLNEDGSQVMSKWNIPQRVNPRKVTNNILRWTQGARSLDDMIKKLSEKQLSNPWLSQLITRLSDKSGKETDFQSQFYSTFSKSQQLYSIVQMENGKYRCKLVNSHPALTDVMNSIISKYKMGECPLFYSNGFVNTSILGSDKTTGKEHKFNLHQAKVELETILTALDKKQPFDNAMAKKVIDIVSKVCEILGYSVSKDLVAEAVNSDNVATFYHNLRYTVKDLDYVAKMQGTKDDVTGEEFKYNPFEFHTTSNIKNSVQNFLTPITDILEDSATTAFYNSGKMYQSYVTPSFLTKLMQSFSLEGEEFENFMQEQYKGSKWFYSEKWGRRGKEETWKTPWLAMLQEPELRKKFAHKVELNFNQHDYMSTMTDAEYTLSIIAEYFAKGSNPRGYDFSWYRVPMQSNKPSSDFIRFVSYRGDNYKDVIVRGLHSMFLQELSRIQTVRMRNLSKGDDGFIDNFDTNGRKFCFLPVFNAYMDNSEASKRKRLRLHRSMEYDADRLEALQNKLSKYNSAKAELDKKMDEFYGDNPMDFSDNSPFSQELNVVRAMDPTSKERTELQNLEKAREDYNKRLTDEDDNTFAQLLQKKIEGSEELTSDEELELGRIADKILYQFNELKVQSILDRWESNGIIEAAKSIEGIYNKDWDSLKPKTPKEKEKHDNYISAHVREQIENFLWNDSFASKNILQLTVTDIAFYKDTENLQKRLSQLHSPGVRGNKFATDYNGNPVSDTFYRTFILKDFDSFISNIIANISEVFDRKIANAKEENKPVLRALKESLVGENGEYRKINVTDAQGYSSPSSYRKKAFIFGKWSKESEAVYQKLMANEDVSLAEIKRAFQPLKPFVYSKTTKDMGVENAPIDKMMTPFQAKNSEYLLVMADAMLQGEKLSRPNLLRAVYRVMEDSESINPTMGIDTVQFESAIKSGLQTPVDISQFLEMENGEDAAYSYMMNKIYKEEYKENPDNTEEKERVYKNYDTDTCVHELSYDAYCLQQDIPEHFKDHYQAIGSQIRMITPSDLDHFTTDSEGNKVVNYYSYKEADGSVKKLTAEEMRREFENTNADNIEESFNDLAVEFGLYSRDKLDRISAINRELRRMSKDDPLRSEKEKELRMEMGNLTLEDKKSRNIAISKILQKEISSSPRYGVELMQACSIDKDGNFRIPKGDPIQSKRIEQLLNSVIKNRLNKQKVAGGPIVQVSNFGTTQQLHIRFNDKNGNLLPLESEYDPSKHDGLSYKDYCKENQGGIAYFEVFAPIWSKEIYDKFSNPDGTMNIKAIEATDPELLKMISYRIPTEDKYSCAPIKVVGFMPKEAGDALMLPYELTSIDDSDFDIDKRFVMRKEIGITTKKTSEIKHQLIDMALESFRQYKEKQWKKFVDAGKMKEPTEAQKNSILKGAKANIINEVKMFLDNPQKMKNMGGIMGTLYKHYQMIAYKTEAPTEGRTYRNNKIVDMTYSVLSNEMSADKILNPGGFAGPKKIAYLITAYKELADQGYSWDALEGKDSDELKDLSYTDKDLTFADTQVQFYKQNAAAASLIGVFAATKIAHAVLESNGFYIDVEGVCGSTPFEIAGIPFGGKMELDVRYDKEGNLIGKTLGLLVSASADAAKDPILNLMNINMTTVNVFNALLRLGMPFKGAALFMSQDIIGRLIDKFNKENLGDNYASLSSIIDQWLDAYAEKNNYNENSKINSEPLTEDELKEGLTSREHGNIDYKVLLAYKKLMTIAEIIRNPTFVTRFNSISSAVGPLIADNLITDRKIQNFTLKDPKSSTGIFIKDENHVDKDGKQNPWVPADINTVLEKHPILEQFARGYDIANIIFSDMPTGSSSFRILLSTLPEDISNKIYGDKKLLDQFSMFYQSYLLTQSGVMNPSNLKESIYNFPKEFMKKGYREKYPNNALIQAIRVKFLNNSDFSYLTANITGMDEQQKEELRYAWTDLHKENPELSRKLFEYSFFLGGIGFSPKTLMALVPMYVKERIKSEDGKASYVGTYRTLPEVVPETVIDQFIRNNWNDNKLVPWKGKSCRFYIDLEGKRLIVSEKKDLERVAGASYMKVKTKKGVTLWRIESVDKKSGSRTYTMVDPLGDNGNYLEINPNGIEEPVSKTLSPKKNDTPSQFDTQSPAESEASNLSSTPVISTSEQALNTEEFVSLVMKKQPGWSKEKAEARVDAISKNRRAYGMYLQKLFRLKGLNLDIDKAIKESEKYC